MQKYLSELNSYQSGRLKKIHSQGLDESVIQEFREQGFLPDTEIRIIKHYPSQGKLVVILNESINIALPYSLADRIEIQNGDESNLL